MDREGFADALRQARERRGLRQDELASMLDRRQSAVSNWESHKSLPEAEDVFRIERCLELDPGTLSQFLGYMPVGITDLSTEAAIQRDEYLDADYREQLVKLYWIFRDGTPAPGGSGQRRGRTR